MKSGVSLQKVVGDLVMAMANCSTHAQMSSSFSVWCIIQSVHVQKQALLWRYQTSLNAEHYSIKLLVLVHVIK
jgi:hypothetical protein